jgi:hypothetical protein
MGERWREDARRAARAGATKVRRAVLLRLVALADDLDVIRVEVTALPTEADRPLVDVRPWNVADVMRRTLHGQLSPDGLRTWARLIEGREDLRRCPVVDEIIFELATPEAVEPLTPQRIEALLGEVDLVA